MSRKPEATKHRLTNSRSSDQLRAEGWLGRNEVEGRGVHLGHVRPARPSQGQAPDFFRFHRRLRDTSSVIHASAIVCARPYTSQKGRLPGNVQDASSSPVDAEQRAVVGADQPTGGTSAGSCGLVVVLMALAGWALVGLVTFIVLLVASMAVAVVYSYRVWREDPERNDIGRQAGT